MYLVAEVLPVKITQVAPTQPDFQKNLFSLSVPLSIKAARVLRASASLEHEDPEQKKDHGSDTGFVRVPHVCACLGRHIQVGITITIFHTPK